MRSLGERKMDCDVTAFAFWVILGPCPRPHVSAQLVMAAQYTGFGLIRTSRAKLYNVD
jgi:hypothetical protein